MPATLGAVDEGLDLHALSQMSLPDSIFYFSHGQSASKFNVDEHDVMNMNVNESLAMDNAELEHLKQQVENEQSFDDVMGFNEENDTSSDNGDNCDDNDDNGDDDNSAAQVADQRHFDNIQNEVNEPIEVENDRLGQLSDDESIQDVPPSENHGENGVPADDGDCEIKNDPFGEGQRDNDSLVPDKEIASPIKVSARSNNKSNLITHSMVSHLMASDGDENIMSYAQRAYKVGGVRGSSPDNTVLDLTLMGDDCAVYCRLYEIEP